MADELEFKSENVWEKTSRCGCASRESVPFVSQFVVDEGRISVFWGAVGLIRCVIQYLWPLPGADEISERFHSVKHSVVVELVSW
jgi:hypothetical protein